MLVTCPNCSARYSVPDRVVGMNGRTMRCSRCQNQWDQPFVASQPEARPKRPEPRMVVDPPRPRAPEPVMASAFEESDSGDDLLAAAMRDEERGDDGADDGDTGGGGPNPFDRIAEMMMEQPPAPVPDLFANAGADREPRRRGIGGLIAVVAVILVLVIAAVAYFLQDTIITKYPATARYYDKLDVRKEVVGAGLSFRDYSSERTGKDASEVLVVRGVIANTTDQERAIPPLRLVLYDGQTVVQDKTIDPPQAKLDGKGTVGFKITLDQPDPHASRFEVTFAKQDAPAKAQ